MNYAITNPIFDDIFKTGDDLVEKLTNTMINIAWERLCPREWLKVGCGTANTAGKVSKYGVFYSVFSSNAGKYEPEKTPYLDTFHAVTTLATAEPRIYACSEKQRHVNYFVWKIQNYGEMMKGLLSFFVRNDLGNLRLVTETDYLKTTKAGEG